MGRTELDEALDDVVERSATPPVVRLGLDRLETARPGSLERLAGTPTLARAVVAVLAASRSLTVVLETDEGALDVLDTLDTRPPLDDGDRASLRRWKQRELLRIAAADLLGLSSMEVVGARLAALADDVLASACRLSGAEDRLAVVGMGKLGGEELNYASDVDVMFVGDGEPGALEKLARGVMDVTRLCFRVDANLRPQGRDGPLVRSLSSYEAYWDRWAEPWEYQALLKARPAAGSVELGAGFCEASGERLWNRHFSAEDLRSLRAMKARAEAEVAKKGLADRELKRGRGGIRDVEFSVQLLQLVHGRHDAALRVRTTLVALGELGAAGYVDPDDAGRLGDAYRTLRTVEHRLQLVDEQQVHALPTDVTARTRLARVLGHRDTGDRVAVEQFDAEMARVQGEVRSIHERLYFRPLLEAFSDGDQLAAMGAEAADARLAAFGFTDGVRTRQAVRELTRGLTRSSRLMQQMLPLLLHWLSDAPDPDLGLLCLRNMASGPHRSTELAVAFRDSPEAARTLCLVAGTSLLLAEIIRRNPDLIGRLPDPARLRTQPRSMLLESASQALGWRDDVEERRTALKRWKERNLVGIAVRDLLGVADIRQVGTDLSALAEATLQVALESLSPRLPFAVLALGRFGGAELSYASDLDVVFVYDGDSPSAFAEAERLATSLRRFVGGATPSARIYELDADLRPEGRQGPLARSVEGYRTYFDRWALAWERQAMARARPVAGDHDLARRLQAELDPLVWRDPLPEDDVREIRRLKARVERERIPPGEDPQFHLKLGRGSLSDVEFTAQLLQLRHGIREPGAVAALARLAGAGALSPDDHRALLESYEFCEHTRNRLFLVQSGPGDALPQKADQLARLARSLDTTGPELREHYRRVTRRARAVVERVFYGRE